MSFNELAIYITAENFASAEFNRVASDAASMGAGVKASAAQMAEGFRATGSEAVAMGENVRASASGFAEVQTQAEATTVSLTTVARA